MHAHVLIHARDFECRAFMENLRSWVALCLMDIFILELVSNQLNVPVKIDGRQEQEENFDAIEPGSMYTHVGHTRDYKYSIFKTKMRSWVAWCFMEAFILIVLTVPVKIDGRQQHEETRSLLKPGTNTGQARDF